MKKFVALGGKSYLCEPDVRFFCKKNTEADKNKTGNEKHRTGEMKFLGMSLNRIHKILFISRINYPADKVAEYL